MFMRYKINKNRNLRLPPLSFIQKIIFNTMRDSVKIHIVQYIMIVHDIYTFNNNMKTKVKLTKDIIDPTHFAFKKESTVLHYSNQNTSRAERAKNRERNQEMDESHGIRETVPGTVARVIEKSGNSCSLAQWDLLWTIPERIHPVVRFRTIRKNQARSIPSRKRVGFIITLLKRMVHVAIHVSQFRTAGDQPQ